MRLRLTLVQEHTPQIIPLNYQYYLSTFIYKTIALADNEYSMWLHEKGYENGYKKFKFFTFSALNIPKFEIKGKHLEILTKDIEFTLSMIADKTVENFIIGIFNKKSFSIYDNTTTANFNIKFVEKVPDPEFSGEMCLKTMSPIVLSRQIKINDKQEEEYLSPDKPEYSDYFKKSLEEKYIAYCMHHREQVKELKVESLEILNNPKSKLITIKEGTLQETKIRGYLYEFKIKADPEIIELGYQVGFGKLCSLGMGCVKNIN